MAESTTNPPLMERPREAEVYRPLSGLAVAAFCLSGFYAGVLAIVALTSLLSRTPPFLSPWTLVVPAAAAILALAARQHLKYAEGTRSGAGLITWSLRLSALGLLYLAIYLATFLAVKMQAERFTRAWFDKLKEGKVAAAFLDTRKPDEREGDDPNDEARLLNRYGNSGGGKGEYPQFRESDLVQILKSPGAKIDDQGVRELEYEQGGYRVELSYRVTTDEGEFDWIITVRSSNTRKQREWMIIQPQVRLADRPRYTPLGEARAMMKDDALRFIMQSANNRSTGNLMGFYLDTLEPSRREEVMTVIHNRMVGAIGMEIGNARHGGLGFLAGQVSLNEAERGAVPGFAEFKKGTIAVVEAARDAGDPNPLIAEAAAGFSQPETDLRLRVGEAGRLMLTVIDENKVRCEKEVDVAVLDKNAALTAGPKITVEGRMVVEGQIEPGKRTQWRLVKVGLAREKAPGPPGGRPGGPPGR
jgi:hypothetical protein